MELAALIIFAASSLVGGALAFGAYWLAQRYWRLYYPRWWMAAGGAFAGLVISAALVTGWPMSMLGKPEQVPPGKVLPYMQVMHERDKILYERVLTQIVRDQQEGKAPEEVRTNAKSLVLSYVADKVSGVSDELTYQWFTWVRDALGHLHDIGAYDLCAPFALGKTTPDFDAKLNDELFDRESNLIARIVASTFQANAPKMGAEPFAALAAQAFADASQTTGIPPNEVETLLSASGEPRQVCRLMKAFFDAVLSQPEEVAASALREMSAGERSGR